MSYNEKIEVAELKEKLSYDAEAGKLIWLVKPSKNVFAGEEAGCVKATRASKSGEKTSYRYIRLNGENIPAARVAWAIHHGEWPMGRVTFKDGDPLNLRAGNLESSKSVPGNFNFSDKEDRKLYLREHRRIHGRDWKDWDLRRKFDLSLVEYGKILVSQDGKCAICGSEDGGTRNGKPKALAVDHDHKTRKIRGLLCESCNQGLGKLKDDIEILLKAVEYLRKHSDIQKDVPMLTLHTNNGGG